MPHSQMIINYVPGDECRVAIVEDGKLEELYAERFAAASRVGNIYVGKVTNVEPSIQAAFIDFGVEENGFLHYSDLHPRYFPGEDVEETTERVGHKTPRRERPPIQHCLRRGDEVTVQVLKEGVGTKGPTLTSYLSIPGRFLVMMPQMDKVGVSRKVEDEDQRRQMREILDQLELPEGFGFILRTAGLDRTKAELKRDLAYLQRLWKDMEKRLASGTKPRLLYSESDLLVRSLRDQLTTDINEVIIDHELALQRAARFMKIVSPRSQTKLLHYPGKTPVFHGFGIEKQIAMIHAREVPLPGGGRLVIDQTEALVAIDVNSGKMRDSKDAETNAYKTNVEAVDEICRQLRLRDLGGIVVNDLIDMRHASHRKDIENRFRERLKRDRARTTTAPISAFGILEMTRQRMRGSHESVHFVDCPTCRGRGLVQRPDSVAADALRELAAILDIERVARVELVVAPRVAGELLSGKRQLLGRIERASGKHVDVRVSETVALDRVSFYAYDPAGADIDVTAVPEQKRQVDLKQWELPAAPADEGEAWAADAVEEAAAAAVEPELVEDAVPPIESHPIEFDEVEDVAAPVPAGPAGEESQAGGGRKRRRRRRRGRGGGGGVGMQGAQAQGQHGHRGPQGGGARTARPEPAVTGQPAGMSLVAEGGGAPEPGAEAALPPGNLPVQGNGQGQGGAPGQEGGRRRRRRRRGRGRGGMGSAGPGGEFRNGAPVQEGPGEPAEAVPQGPSPVEAEMAPNGQPGEQDAVGGYRNYRKQAPERPAPAEAPHGAEPALVPAAPIDEGEEPFDVAGGPPNGAGGEGQRGGRRRRRRRRGRGGGGGQGQDGQGRAQGGDQRAPNGQRGSSPQQSQQQPQGSRSAPPPVPDGGAGGPAQGGVRPPKLLYSSRRRLMPSELAKRPKPE